MALVLIFHLIKISILYPFLLSILFYLLNWMADLSYIDYYTQIKILHLLEKKSLNFRLFLSYVCECLLRRIFSWSVFGFVSYSSNSPLTYKNLFFFILCSCDGSIHGQPTQKLLSVKMLIQ